VSKSRVDQIIAAQRQLVESDTRHDSTALDSDLVVAGPGPARDLADRLQRPATGRARARTRQRITDAVSGNETSEASSLDEDGRVGGGQPPTAPLSVDYLADAATGWA
jgi:hypothetical protein